MGIEQWSPVAGNNNQAPPNGWPGGMLPSQVEPTARQMMASLAAWYQAAEWINYNFPIVYSSATVFTISSNQTALYHVGRRVQATDGSTSVFGTISSSVFTSLTTVTVVWDTGVLQTGVTIVYVGITSAVNTSAPALGAAAFANPTGTIGLAAVNGSATTAMRSDAAPPLSQTITPTWLGTHIWRGDAVTVLLRNTAAAAVVQLGTVNAVSGAGSVTDGAIGYFGTNLAIYNPGHLVSAQFSAAAITFGNATDNPTFTFTGTGAFTVGSAGTFNSGLSVNAATRNVASLAQTALSFGNTTDNPTYAFLGTGTATVTGRWNFTAPTASECIVATASNSDASIVAIGSGTTGSSFGFRAQAGTNASDYSIKATNNSNSLLMFQVRGDGVVQGNDGTNLFELGYKDIPQNLQTVSYAAVLADRGKGIDMNGTTLTATIPANASVAFPVGTTLVFTNLNASSLSIAITTDTLTLAGTTTTGTRTLVQNGVATARKVGTTSWIIAGSGLS